MKTRTSLLALAATATLAISALAPTNASAWGGGFRHGGSGFHNGFHHLGYGWGGYRQGFGNYHFGYRFPYQFGYRWPYHFGYRWPYRFGYRWPHQGNTGFHPRPCGLGDAANAAAPMVGTTIAATQVTAAPAAAPSGSN